MLNVFAFIMQISASVVHSDYHQDNSPIERTVLIEFILLSATENCSLSRGCDFEGECEEWSVGGGVRLLTGAEVPVQALSSNQGMFVCSEGSVFGLSRALNFLP